MMLLARVLLRPSASLSRGAAPPRRRNRAVGALVWGAATFVLATAALSVSIETVFVQVRDPEYGARLVGFRSEVRAHPNRPVVPVLGTSRTQNAIDPLSMGFPDEAGSPLLFNFGHSGIRPLHLRLGLWRLHTAGVRPAAVLVEVFPAQLCVVGPADPAFHDAEQLTGADVDWLAPYLDDPAALRRRWVRTRLEPWSAHRGVLLAHCAPEALPLSLRIDHAWTMVDRRGFLGYPPAQVTEERRARKRAEMHDTYGPALGDLHVSADTEEAYRGIVADCRARGVPVAFYLAPESPVYRSWYAPRSRAALAAFVRMLRDELGCPVFDAPTDFVEEDFADGHHILRPAAARFSRELAERHLSAWLSDCR